MKKGKICTKMCPQLGANCGPSTPKSDALPTTPWQLALSFISKMVKFLIIKNKCNGSTVYQNAFSIKNEFSPDNFYSPYELQPGA